MDQESDTSWNQMLLKVGDWVEFTEDVFTLAFGINAIHKGYSFKEVVVKLREYSDASLRCEKGDCNEETN